MHDDGTEPMEHADTPLQDSANNAACCAPGTDAEPNDLAATRRLVTPIRITVASAVVFAVGYGAFQRIGTTANASTVEFTRNLAGGFVALGFTNEQAGFIVLSRLDRGKATVYADQAASPLAGTYTVVRIETPRQHWRTRLRGPLAILIHEDGRVESTPARWTYGDFETMRRDIDCSFESASRRKRCGALFTDLHETLADKPAGHVPGPVRSFLAQYAGRRAHSDTTATVTIEATPPNGR